MNEILFIVGDVPVRMNAALVAFGLLALILLLTIAIVIARSGRKGAEAVMAQAVRADELEERLGRGDVAEIKQNLVPEPGVEQVQHGVFRAADI